MIHYDRTLFTLLEHSAPLRLHNPGKWIVIGNLSPERFGQLCRDVGEVLYTTQVTPREQAPALVVSNRALPLHCDHHRADLIAWYCHANAEAGGETLLLDFEELYGTLPSKMKAALEHLAFREHKVFAEDCEQHPFHTVSRGRSRFYYSFWPVDHTLTSEVEAAYLALKELIAAQHPVAIRLQPGDALFIDNTQVLHGRTAFVGTARHLERNWIRLSQFD